MKPFASIARSLVAAFVLMMLPTARPARAQLPTTDERLQILTDPETVKKKAAGDKERPPLEFFRSQIAPFDILPYVKPNHWSTLSLELRANRDDYEGLLQTEPVLLLGMPQRIVYRRDARLAKTDRARRSMQVMLPVISKEGLSVELTRPEAIRADEIWQASLKALEPHQMLIIVMAKEANDAYTHWNQFQALYPFAIDRDDPQLVDRQRYYRLVLPLDPDKPLVSAHPLTWSPISHVIWDGMPPGNLNPFQQEAMLDWLHWGGQLVLIGGAGPSFSTLSDSFLSPYLPADPSGANALLNQTELKPLADSYPPPVKRRERDEQDRSVPFTAEEGFEQSGRRYGPAEPIRPASNRPLFLAGLRPRPGATTIPLGEHSKHLLGVEWRVGRGRILMLALNPSDPALLAWPGLDTMVRRVLLRRPEEPRTAPGRWSERGYQPPTIGALSGPELSWVRYFGRDLGASAPRPAPYVEATETDPETIATKVDFIKGEFDSPPLANPHNSAVAEWIDSSLLPKLSREVLEEASGITIPSSSFVLKVILAYVIVLVPLNWLICRYVLGRREWAWVVVPILSLGFAIGVERVAAYDVGYNSACDEIDLIEIHGGYPRAHVSRFASIFSTGRVRFTISYPHNMTALALPLSSGHALKGEDISTAVWQSSPVAALEGFQVQPRSLALFRAEEMVTLPGSISLLHEDGPRRIVNGTDFELQDAMLVEVNGPNDRDEIPLGTIGPGASVAIADARVSPITPTTVEALDPRPFLHELRAAAEDLPEEQGELRLVAWVRQPFGGQKLEPAVDRHRGMTLIVVHLSHPALPDPAGPVYNLLARGPERPLADEGEWRDQADPRTTSRMNRKGSRAMLSKDTVVP